MSDLLQTRTSRRAMLGLLGAGVGAAALGLSGCTGVSTASSAAEASDAKAATTRSGFSQAPVKVPAKYAGRTNILFWAPFSGVNYLALQKQFTQFNDSQDKIFAATESQADYATLYQKFTAALQAKVVPDIVCFPEHRWLQFWQADALSSLDRYFDKDWSLDVYMHNYTPEGQAAGHTYVVPFARSTPLFYFNRDLFAKAGLPETGPTTWTEYAQMAPDLLKVNVSGKALKAFAFGATDEWYGQSHIWAWGGRFSDRTTVTVDQGPMAEWLGWMNTFIHKNNFGYMSQDAFTDFTSGVTAAAHQSTAALAGATKTAKFNIGTAFLLGKDSAGPKVPTGGSGLSIVRAESKERQDACAELFKFLAKPEQSAQWHKDTGYLPIVIAAAQTSIVKDLQKANPNFVTALNQVKNAQSADTITWFDGPVDNINKAMASVYGDGKDAKSQVATLQTALEPQMKKFASAIEKVKGQ